MIELENIVAKRGGSVVLDGVSLVVPTGSFVSVLGESGTGKTTLLSVISGLLPQTSGRVLFDGKNVDNVPTHKRNVAMVFQDSRLFPNMNVLDNVAFALKMQGVAKSTRYRLAREKLDAVHLSDLEQRGVGELSGGQRQRVALARALAAAPYAVLLDEPFSGLDESLRDDMRQLVLSLHEQTGITMLMVTHDAREALLMSDEMAYVAGGKIVQAGKPADILLAPATAEVAASFGATMAVEGQVKEGLFACRKLVVPASNVDDGPAVLLRTHAGQLAIHPLAKAGEELGAES